MEARINFIKTLIHRDCNMGIYEATTNIVWGKVRKKIRLNVWGMRNYIGFNNSVTWLDVWKLRKRN